MRYVHKTARKSLILRLYGTLLIGLFSIFITGGLSLAEGVECGDEITTYTVLTNDLDCSNYFDGPALILKEGAKLNLNGKKVIGNNDISCIKITGNGAWVRNGTIMECEEGILIEESARSKVINVTVKKCKEGILIEKSARNKFINVKACENKRRGFRIKKSSENLLINCLAEENGRKGFSIEENGDDNLLVKCLAKNNGQQGFKIEIGDGNKIYYSKAIANCRDGIEIDGGTDNRIINNLVEDNGNEGTCENFGEAYNRWFYAGIDVTAGTKEHPSEYNEIKYNHACGNLGCIGSEIDPCEARERNFWDENVDDKGNCDSTNEWENNTVCPECTPGP